MEMRGNRRRKDWFHITARNFLMFVSVVGMASAAVYWGGVQLALTDSWPIAIASAIIIVVSPPALISFVIPWSPGGMLLQKINARTLGYPVVLLCSLFFLWYVFDIQFSWWAAQPVVAETDLVLHQVGIWIIGSIIIPGLLLAQVTDDELVEAARQAHVVKRYRLQTQADLAILRSQLLRARQLTLRGFANLVSDEREELSNILQELVRSIDSTLYEYNQGIKAVSGTVVPFESLEDNPEIQEYLDYVAESLESASMPDERRSLTTEKYDYDELPPYEYDYADYEPELPPRELRSSRNGAPSSRQPAPRQPAPRQSRRNNNHSIGEDDDIESVKEALRRELKKR
jgi:hypothetical protein